ncbi:MAG: GGDEF domain-containing protein [Lachnospiraceae bacterium]|nr:GGDEF domain-containing protein [Lachnospiraceae bacterium]
MDLQAFVDSIDVMTCVISVEMKEDGKYGDIRLVVGNKAYVKSIETVWDGPQLMSTKFVPNSLYQNYFPQDLNFETVCYRAAVEKVPVHTYVHPERFDFWFDLFLLPLCNEGNLYYCTYTQQVSQKGDTRKMSHLSENTATEVLNICLKLHDTQDFKETMAGVMKDIRELCKARACSIMLIDKETRTCKVLAEDREDKREQSMMRSVVRRDPNFYDIAETWEDTIGGSNCLIVKDENGMEYVRQKNPVWYKSLQGAGVWSIVLFPLKTGNDLLGYMWATNFETQNADHIKETLELATYFVTSEIANDQLLRRLKILSSMDMLTGVMNRNEMNNRIDRIVSGEDQMRNLGIVFADLNGLKRVNDDKGHISGDQLLKQAAATLQEVFPEGSIFRAGGDEFMAIIPDTSEEKLIEKAETLRNSELGFGSACFAVGACFIEDSKDILKALHISDERMYADKERFYKEHPELKR